MKQLAEDIAYHHTYKDFDTFNAKYIGSGLGGQAYGWGFYFTLYDDAFYYNGYYDKDKTSIGYAEYNGKRYKIGSKAYNILGLISDGVKGQELINGVNKILGVFKSKKYKEQVLNMISNINPKDIKFKNMQYMKIQIPTMNYYLDDSKDLAHQSAIVKLGLSRIAKQYNLSYTNEKFVANPEEITSNPITNDEYKRILISHKEVPLNGKTVYRWLEMKLNLNHKQTSLLLSKYGIKGLKHYDNFGYKDCVLIFDPKVIKIIKKYNDYTDLKKDLI